MRRVYTLSPTGRAGRPRRQIEIMMTPMIDVIFLLLVFFLATTSFQLVEQLLPSAVSNVSMSSGQSQDPRPDPTDEQVEQIVVKLSSSDSSTVAEINGTALPDLGQLRERLEAIGLIKATVPVIIDPAADVRVADVISAYDAARAAGLARVYFATRK